MASPCSVCTHEEHDLVDELLAGGMGNREAARRFGLHRDAIRRHKENHLSVLGHMADAEDDDGTLADPGSALARLERLFVRMERVLSAAERSGNVNQTIAASRELWQVTEVVAKIRGELDERTQVNVLNLSTDATWLATRAAMLDAQRPYPDAAAAVAARLAALDEGGAHVLPPGR